MGMTQYRKRTKLNAIADMPPIDLTFVDTRGRVCFWNGLEARVSGS